MIKKLDITNPIVAQQVLTIQLPAYQVEAALIDFYELPPLKDTVDTLRQCGETFYGYYVNDELSGVVSIKIENGIMDIHRLFVHPSHFKQGIAKQLLDFIQMHEQGFETIIVSTGSKNIPAIHFYQKNRFSIIEEIKAAENLSLTLFEKKIQ